MISVLLLLRPALRLSQRASLLENFGGIERRDMEPFNNRPDDKGHTRVFGIPRDYRERQHRPLEVTGDTTAWDIYNHQAGMIERERVKDWNDTLNTLLIFVRDRPAPTRF